MQKQEDLFQGFVTHEQHKKVVGLDFIANAHYPFNVSKKLICPGEQFTVLSLQDSTFICATDNEYFVINAKDLKLIVTSHDTTESLPATLLRSVSTLNYLFLRELFRPENNLDDAIRGEIKDFLYELSQEEDLRRHRKVKELLSTEIHDGDYFEDLSISDVRSTFYDYFFSFLQKELAEMMTDYYMSLIPEGSGPRTDDIAIGSTDKYSIKPGDRLVQAMVSLNPEHGNEEYPGHTEVLFWLEVDGKDASDVSSIFVKTS